MDGTKRRAQTEVSNKPDGNNANFLQARSSLTLPSSALCSLPLLCPDLSGSPRVGGTEVAPEAPAVGKPRDHFRPRRSRWPSRTSDFHAQQAQTLAAC